MTHDDDAGDIAFEDLHPMTQHILSRRGFLGTAGKAGMAAASISFLGMTVIGCSKDETLTTPGGPAGTKAGTTAGSGGPATTAKPMTGGTKMTGTTGSSAAAGDTLYKKLGGNAAITKVIGDFLTIVVADTRINKFFVKADPADLKKKLIEQVGGATGGPEKYSGRPMKEVHAGLKITVADFNALVEDLVKAFDDNKVAKDLQTPVLEVLDGMRSDIVTA